MKRKIRARRAVGLWVLVCGAVVVCGDVLAGPVPETRPAAKIEKSEATRELLRSQGLKRVARQDPEEAIRALDSLRSWAEVSAEGVALAIAEVALAAGRGALSPAQAAGFFLCAAAETYAAALEQAAGGAGGAPPGGAASALELHRQAVEGLIESLQVTRSPAEIGQAHGVAGPLARYQLTWVDAAEAWTPATHEFLAASTLPRKKRQHLARRPGVGVPVVAVRRGEVPDEPETEGGLFPIYVYFYPLTAVLELGDGEEGQPRPATLRFLDPRVDDKHSIGAMEYPLAMDIGAQLAALTREIDVTFARGGVRHAGKYVSLAGIYLLEPLRPGRIPAVLIHGLSSSPKTWAEAFEVFELDPDLRRGYQFWFFAYPTGLAFPYSAKLLRQSLVEAMQELDAAGLDPDHRRAVLIGHSMGGLLTRLQVTDSGSRLWDAVFTQPPDQLDLEAEDVDALRETLIVEPLPFVARAVFCSTPHRGSKYAANALGKLGASLVKVPAEAAHLGERVVIGGVDILTPSEAKRGRPPDSVQTLQPESPILKALDGLEIDPSVAYHSIIGDRGKGDSPDSSDGVVPYWSSHLEGAASEKIVPSGHGSHQHPQGVAELRRILHQHLEASRQPQTAVGEEADASRPAVVRQAVADLAARLGVGVDEIAVRGFETVTWPDASLGCPEPGMAYAQMVSEGTRIELAAQERVYTYHAGGGREPFLCERQRAPVPAEDER